MNDTQWRIHDSAVVSGWRAHAGKSLADLERSMGYARQTLARKEASGSDMSLNDVRHWAEACGLDPATCLVQLDAPEQEDETRRWLANYILRSAPSEFVIAQAHLLRGGHGSDPVAYAQKMLADLQCPIEDRIASANLTMAAYKLAAARGCLSDPEGPQPDLELLARATTAGFSAAVKGDRKYTIRED